MKKSRGLRFAERIGIAVLFGVVTGMLLQERAVFLGEIGTLLIRLLKALATPLIFFAIINAICKTRIEMKSGFKLLLISGVNAGVAACIAVGVSSLFVFMGLSQRINEVQWARFSSAGTPDTSRVNLLKGVTAFVPENIAEPFLTNNIISIVVMAILVGSVLRSLKEEEHHDGIQPSENAGTKGLEAISNLVSGGLQLTSGLLAWVVKGVPFAVFGVVAKIVGVSGLSLLTVLGTFVVYIVTGIIVHCFVYYSLLIWFLVRKSPVRFFRNSGEAMMMALGTGSSLATLPVTLRTLQTEMKVSTESSMLAACVGTNLNHDGILLYEAMAALFIAQLHGIALTLPQKFILLGTSALAAVGIAGIPDAGLITLSLVLGSAGLPLTMVPALMTVDWLIGRLRAMTNVTSDMVVANVLDRYR